MLTITKIDTNDKNQAKKFVHFPYQHYKNCPYWVPPLFIDANLYLNRQEHPFFEHSDADLQNLNGVEYKNHRVYRKNLD